MIQEKPPVSGMPVDLRKNYKPKPQPNDGLQRHIIAGYTLVALMLVAVFGWAATTVINGAVVGAGRVVVRNDEKLVQHPVGGVVGQIFVQEGSRVQEGQVVVRLDDTALKANLVIIDSEISSLKARLARLKAERDGDEEITFPDDMLASTASADVDAIRTEEQYFQSRARQQDNHRDQLQKKVDQLREQEKGYQIMIESRKKQLDLYQKDLETALGLLRKNLSVRSQVTNLQQNVARLQGEYGTLITQKASLSEQISETELQVSGLGEDRLTEIMKDLRETEARLAELDARHITASDQLSRVDIRSPVTGSVHELSVHTIGGVVNAGEAIMKIVPEETGLQFETRINPSDIDQIHVGQQAHLRFPAFNRTKTPDVFGTIVMVGADASTDRQTGRSYYEVKIAPEENMDAKLKEKGVALVPGMPVEAFIETGDRTTLSYLLKPLTDEIQHAFREE